MRKVYRCLTIAGSDSSGGAGIQEDLKTMMVLGVHGMSAITSVTAQNTVEVRSVYDLPIDSIKAQIRAVVDDIGVDAVKTGMLHTSEIIGVVADELERLQCPIVVDPVMISKSSTPLLLPEAKETLIKRIFPLSTIVTPNAMEAEAISGIRVGTIEEGKRAAEKIASMGPKSVLVKGGHIFETDKAVDLLLHDGEFTLLVGERYETKDTHGTGCSFASAIAAGLAKGKTITESASEAKEFVNTSIKFGLRIGKGSGPLNPAAKLFNDAERYNVLENIHNAVAMLESCPEVRDVIAEVQMNIGMALPYATGIKDVAAIEGRIVKMSRGVKATGCPQFGASSHVARTVLAVKSFEDSKRAAINLRYGEDIVRALEEMGLTVSFYDRREEPPEVKNREGGTTFWGAEQAVKRAGRVPDAIYHVGDWGKEAMVTLVGESAEDVAAMTVKLAKILSSK
jgi:hydroxymethylpyrimidine kinase / phosphomethylpyrimidine kinase / thiamine-phosphate diphosphorylase